MRRGLRSVADNARYAKLRGQVGEIKSNVSKVVETKKLLNSTSLPVHGKSHVFLEKIVKKSNRETILGLALYDIYPLISIELSVIVGNVGCAISCDKDTFTIKRPFVNLRMFSCASEERICTIWCCRICITPSCANPNIITQSIHMRAPA